MTHLRGLAVLVALGLAATGLAACGTAASDGTRRADRLPDVTLQSLTGGDSVRLRALRGPMVVNLWASWCTPCRKELPRYEAFSAKHRGAVKVVGVDFQETRPDAARALARRSGVSYPLVTDPDGRVRALGLPKLIVLDRQGRIVHEQYVEITSVGQLERIVARHLGKRALEGRPAGGGA